MSTGDGTRQTCCVFVTDCRISDTGRASTAEDVSAAPYRQNERMFDPETIDMAVLALVLERHPAPVHEADLGRAFAGDDWAASLSALVADGVLHRAGSLLLASRAAVRVGQLLG